MSNLHPRNLINELSTSELWLLLSQFAPVYVLGIENPYLGWLADEIEAANREAAVSLLARGLVRPLDDESVDVDDDLLALVEACASPTHSAILQISSQDGQGTQVYLHFRDGLVVEHQETSPGNHLLRSIPSRQNLLEYVNGVLGINGAVQGRGGSYDLPESALYQVVEMVGKGDRSTAAEILKTAGVAQAEAQALLAALSSPTANASIVVIANQSDPNAQYVRGFGILQSAADLWLMRPFDQLGQPQVEFIPVDCPGVYQRVEETLPFINHEGAQ